MGSYSMAKFLDFAVPTIFGTCSFITGAFLFRLINGHFFLSGGKRHSLFFDQSS
jgi:hypothetical protein